MIKADTKGVNTSCEIAGKGIYLLAELTAVLRSVRAVIEDDDVIRDCIQVAFMPEDELKKELEKL